MTDEAECVVVGAGVVGLAVAYALARRGRDVVVLEAASAIGTGISARSSEVIHAGLYDPPGSNRAQLCVAGRHALLSFCGAHGVATRLCGKLIVATTDAELDQVAALETRGRANGVEGLRILTARQAIALEPQLFCTGALLSPDTGIVDSHALMLALLGLATDHGAMVVCRTPVERIDVVPDGFVLQVGGAQPMPLRCRGLVNAAGLGAVALAQATAGLSPAFVPHAYLSKGSYFVLSGPAPFRHLIYPVPIPGGAGIHLTFDLCGGARFGPDVEAVDCENYDVDPARAARFVAAVRRYWPGLQAGGLLPGYAGIRPKIGAPEQPQDFIIQGPETHGIAGLVNLFGIESPGLTSCLTISERVAAYILAV